MGYETVERAKRKTEPKTPQSQSTERQVRFPKCLFFFTLQIFYRSSGNQEVFTEQFISKPLKPERVNFIRNVV